MSTSYYLRNKKDYEEYQNYLNFLEKLKVDTNQKIKEYCDAVNGKLINADFVEDAEDVVSSLFNKLDWEVGYEDQEIGTKTRNGFSYYSYSLGLEEIKRRCESGEYEVIDEYDKILAYEEFLNVVKS